MESIGGTDFKVIWQGTKGLSGNVSFLTVEDGRVYGMEWKKFGKFLKIE